MATSEYEITIARCKESPGIGNDAAASIVHDKDKPSRTVTVEAESPADALAKVAMVADEIILTLASRTLAEAKRRKAEAKPAAARVRPIDALTAGMAPGAVAEAIA